MAILKVHLPKTKHIIAPRRNLPKAVDVRTSFAQLLAPSVDWCDVARATIAMLPDVVLLEIFDSYVDEARIEAWHRLVHVCRKWRIVTFGPPRRLNLRLHCKASTPVRKTLDVWPLLPIVIRVYGHEMWDGHNIVSAIEHNDRICELDLFDIPSSRLEKVLAAMRQPFSALTRLQLQPRGEAAPAVPTSFLGGSAPCLQTLFLNRIQVPSPGLTNLLSSATHLVDLYLFRISHSGYISPEAFVTCLAVLTRLETLHIGFESPRCHPEQTSRRPPPATRTLLPVLTKLWFKGVGNYLEDLVAQVDAPLLDKFSITFFHQLIYDTPQLTSVVHQNSRHAMKHVWSFTIGTFPSHFHRYLTVCSSWKYYAGSQTGSFRLWRRSAARPSLRLSLLGWNTSTSKVGLGNCIGKMTSRIANGWKFSTRLPL